MTTEGRRDEKKQVIHIPIAIFVMAVGIFIALVSTVYALTLQPIRDNESSLQNQITDIQNASLSSGNDITNIKINVALICNALKINCKQ